jgi:predicted nucleic acid-binding protein
VKFWDSSALVPLIVDEPASAELGRFLVDDPDFLVWTLTSVELLSMLGRLGRVASGLDDLIPGLRSDALGLLDRAIIVSDVDGVRRRAERLVGVHPLAAADAMQLGAAIIASGDRPKTLPFITMDRQLARCAQLEGFQVSPGRSS